MQSKDSSATSVCCFVLCNGQGCVSVVSLVPLTQHCLLGLATGETEEFECGWIMMHKEVNLSLVGEEKRMHVW